jgi:hypothetical protein
MTQREIQNLILLGLGGFAIYYLFFRKTAVAVPFPTSVMVTPQIVGTGINNPSQEAQIVNGQWQPGPGGFPVQPQATYSGGVWKPGSGGFPATEDNSGNYVLVA